MIQLESSTLSNQDISSALLTHTYTADDVRKLFVRLFADQVAGNGDYVGYVTIQRLGAGSAYRVIPITTAAAASGVTAVSMTTIPFPVANSDVVKVYLTGLAGDTTTPDIITEIWDDEATALTSGSGGFSVNASGATITTGNETNSYTDTATAGTIHIVEDAAGTTDFYYEFDVGDYIGTVTEFVWTGYVQSNNDSVDVQYYDWSSTSWKTLEVLNGANGTTLTTLSFDVPVGATGTGANFGLARMRFSSATTTAIGTDRVRCAFSVLSTGIANGSTITLTSTQTNKNFVGENWNLVLNGQDISGSYFRGAKSVTGIASASTEVTFENCNFGAATVPPGEFRGCGVGLSSGTFTAASAGEYLFRNCVSRVPGAGTPVMVFSGLGATTGINNRGWIGGMDYTLDSYCTLSHEVLAGGGTTVTTGGGDAEIRGTCREVTVTVSASETVQFAGVTGPITIIDSASVAPAVNLYGVASTVADAGSVATNETVSRDTINAEADTALTDYDPPTNAEMEARTLVAADYFDFASDAVTVGTINDGAIGAAAVADIFSTTALAEAYAADGGAGTAAQLLYLILQRLNEFAITDNGDGTSTLTVKKLDGSTTAYTLTLNGDADTDPTSSTRAT